MDRTLKIYRASAGSGKTFTLALEYMKLVINDPYAYRRILAVTFTNKATGEMKERILGKLYGVAYGSDSAKEYFRLLKKELPHMAEREIVENAKLALELLLHDYGHFRIQTIDAFFQTVLRSLAKELDLKGDMEISLEGKELLNEAVDTYIRKLEPESVNLTQVVNYIEEKLEDGKDWQINNELKEFASNILREEYQQRGEKLRSQIDENNGELLKVFYNKVTAQRRAIKEKGLELGERFFAAAEARGYDANCFVGNASRGVWPLFTKFRNGDIPELSNANMALIESKKILKNTDDPTLFVQLLKEAAPLYRELNNCELSLSHYHQLGMLNNIAATLKEENTRENRFMLAETTHLLSSMIGKNTTFIFEKIGTEIDHIFIDEFQDTSKLQWACFNVLLQEVLARGNFNLIVGDVKQSIYRWRNSDWNIMNNIGSFFRKDLISSGGQEVKVDGKVYKSTNFRSDSNIITFNNALYSRATKSIATTYSAMLGDKRLKELLTAYEDVEQAIPEKRTPNCGYAEIRVIPQKSKEEGFKENAIRELMSVLHRLLEEDGIPPGKIAILLRYKNVMPDIVKAFNAEFPDVRIVSDEAYMLSSSPTLQLVVAAMRYIATPEDRINIVNLTRLYNKVIGNRDDAFEDYVSHKELLEFLPLEFREELMHLKGLPVYELIERLLGLLNVSQNESEEAYIYTFLDNATQFLSSKSADLQGFIDAWDENISNECVPAESINSIRMMTIHSSKGLEFHTVIMPFCNWLLTGDTRTSLWCEPKEAPFDELSLLSVPLNKKMANSIYSDDYHKEYLYQIVDNLNIMYVGTTRAKSNLIMFSDGSGGRGETISKLLNKVVENLLFLPGSKLSDGSFTFGTIAGVEKKNKEEEKNDNPFEKKPKALRQPFVQHKNRITFKQSRELAQFLATDSEEQKQHHNIAVGELLHLVMSGIDKAGDVERTLRRLMIEGLIATEKQYDKIKNLVERALSNQHARHWFDGSYRLYNECSILTADGESASRRPDRVMIKDNEAIVVDYKFAKEDSEHKVQVERYMNLLRRMGYTNVKGYLWYVYKNVIREV